ncbi:MAG TPA: rhodanese-related sulfurtransferase [Prolixibacteraceae bacterium]|nr:rhodanese-related sulfurtransferase [Prolixibacteraceae bacterium]
MPLYNSVDRKVLIENLMSETFARKTVSFYRYFILDDPQGFRDQLYREWSAMNCFGRIYIAREGINAQMSIPEENMDNFLESLSRYPIFDRIPVKYAIEDNGKSFYKLSIRVKPKLVADGLDDDAFDVTNVGRHLDAREFHDLVGTGQHIVVDMRNHYESEIGHFKGAVCPEADTFREELAMVTELLKDKKESKLLLYCTGGIRCEKASAYLKHNGFKDVNQLHGGILEYARNIRQLNLESHFTGKNFVFDERMGESVDGQVIANCHQCGKPCDVHSNCANDLCHLLFIQCEECAGKYEKCCSSECRDQKNASESEKLTTRGMTSYKFGNRSVYRKSFRLAKSADATGPR